MQGSFEKYNRQLLLPGWGAEGQALLSKSSVLVVGAGGLGCPILSILSGIGLRRIGIMDGDSVATHNLHRQTLFGEKHLGKLKAAVAYEQLVNRNSHTSFVAINQYLSPENAGIVNEYDIVIDATDRFTSRYLLGDAAGFYKKVLVHGSIYKFEGQISTFMAGGLSYRDLYPAPPSDYLAPDCESAGVSPAFCALIGSIMAAETIDVVLKRPKWVNKLLVIDADSFEQHVFDCTSLVGSDPKPPIILNSEEYVEFCQSSSHEIQSDMVRELSVQELHEMKLRKEAFTLIDVREQNEYAYSQMGGVLIPMSEFGERWKEVPREGKVVIHCKSGVRSANVIQYLQQQHGYSNLYNLKGGILAWANEIDPSIPKY